MKPSKDEKYPKEQLEIIDKLYNLLELENNTITLHELDTNKDKQQKIIELLPDILKYFAVSNVLGRPKNKQRLYLSIIS